MGQIFSYLSSLDSNILYAVQSIGPGWKPVAFFLSDGLGYWVMIVVFAAALFLLRKHRIALELIAVFLASAAALFVLKHLFHVDRPYMVDPRVIQYATDSGYGFPSAHALLSFVILGWIYLRHPKSYFLLFGSIVLGWKVDEKYLALPLAEHELKVLILGRQQA